MKLPKKMKAAILHELQSPLIIDEVELPPQLEFGQVLVKVHYSGICGSQLGEIEGVKGPDRFLPHLLGHEGAGEVFAIGPGVNVVHKGDHVVMHWMPGSGINAPVPSYSWKGKKLNAGFVTTFNEYAVVSENRLTPIPKEFDLKLASLLGCAVTTGLGVINNNAQMKFGQSVVIFGAGGVGLNMVQGAAMSSCFPIVAVDIHDNKLEMAQKLGATHCFNSSQIEIKEAVQETIGGQGADVTIDNTGNPDVINLAYELTHAQGRTILVGVPKKGNNISIYSLPLHFRKTITGSHGGETKPSIDIPNYIKLNQNGRLNLDSLITDHFTLDDINSATAMMRTGKIAGRCLISM